MAACCQREAISQETVRDHLTSAGLKNRSHKRASLLTKERCFSFACAHAGEAWSGATFHDEKKCDLLAPTPRKYCRFKSSFR